MVFCIDEYFFKIFFLMWTISVFIEFATILLMLFMFWVLGHEAYGMLAPTQTRDLTCTFKLKDHGLNHWISREVPCIHEFFFFF